LAKKKKSLSCPGMFIGRTGRKWGSANKDSLHGRKAGDRIKSAGLRGSKREDKGGSRKIQS